MSTHHLPHEHYGHPPPPHHEHPPPPLTHEYPPPPPHYGHHPPPPHGEHPPPPPHHGHPPPRHGHHPPHHEHPPPPHGHHPPPHGHHPPPHGHHPPPHHPPPPPHGHHPPPHHPPPPPHGHHPPPPHHHPPHYGHGHHPPPPPLHHIHHPPPPPHHPDHAPPPPPPYHTDHPPPPADFGSIAVHQHGNILLLQLKGGSKYQSVFNPPFIKQFHLALDYCEQTKGNKVLIITGTGRFFSAGLDLKYLSNNYDGETPSGSVLTKGLIDICSRILIMGLPTISAINGHAFGGGLYLALCCDFRLMNNNCNNGRLCLAEIKHGMGFPPGLTDLLIHKLSPNVLRTLVFTGKQYKPIEALNAKIIDEVIYGCDTNYIFINKCIEYAEKNLVPLAKNRKNNKRLKYDIYHEIYNNCRKVVEGKLPAGSKL